MKQHLAFVAFIIGVTCTLPACGGGGSGLSTSPTGVLAPISIVTPTPTPKPTSTAPASTAAFTGTWTVVYDQLSGNVQVSQGALPTIRVQDLLSSANTAGTARVDGGGVAIRTNATGDVAVSNNTCPTSFQVQANPLLIDLGDGPVNVLFFVDRSVLRCGFTITDLGTKRAMNVTYSTT